MGVSYLTTAAAADEWKQTVLLQLPDILQIFLSKVCYMCMKCSVACGTSTASATDVMGFYLLLN